MNPNPLPGRPALSVGLFAALSLAASCGGGGGSGGGGSTTPPATALGNLSVSSVEVVGGSDPNAAHEMTLKVTIVSTADMSDVPIAFILLGKEELDNANPEVPQYLVGTKVIPSVPSGQFVWNDTVVIPTEVRQQRDWYLAPYIDISETIPETNEKDNQPQRDRLIPLNILEDQTDKADVVIEFVEADGAFELRPSEDLAAAVTVVDPATGLATPVSDKPDSDWKATIVLSTTGANEVPDVAVYADLYAVYSTGDPDILPFTVWDPDAMPDLLPGPYELDKSVSIKPGEQTTLNLELRLSDEDRLYLTEQMESLDPPIEFVVGFFADKTGEIEEFEGGNANDPGIEEGSEDPNGGEESNNEIFGNIDILLPPPPPEPEPCFGDQPLSYAKPLNIQLLGDNKYVRLGLDFNFIASLDSNGATGEGKAKIPIKIFSAQTDAISLRARGRSLPRPGNPETEFLFEFKVFGVEVFSQNSLPSLSLIKEDSKSQELKASASFSIGPIPFTVTAGIVGTVGYSLTADLNSTLFEVKAVPNANLKVFIEGGIGVTGLSAGLGGELTLVEDTLTGRATAQLQEVQPNGLLTGTLTLELVNVLKGPSGRVYAYADYPWPKFCSAGIFGDIIPCGLKTKRSEIQIASFPAAFTKSDVLFNKVETRSVCVTPAP
ncbi:MAG: hypothetical protein ACI9S9_002579 [Planctomycetota bacterium]|jgi:hypothetical protein